MCNEIICPDCEGSGVVLEDNKAMSKAAWQIVETEAVCDTCLGGGLRIG